MALDKKGARTLGPNADMRYSRYKPAFLHNFFRSLRGGEEEKSRHLPILFRVPVSSFFVVLVLQKSEKRDKFSLSRNDEGQNCQKHIVSSGNDKLDGQKNTEKRGRAFFQKEATLVQGKIMAFFLLFPLHLAVAVVVVVVVSK